MKKTFLLAALFALFAGNSWAQEAGDRAAPAGMAPALADSLSSGQTSEFAGTWDIVSVEPAGAAKDAKRLVFGVDGQYSALGAGGEILWAGTFELDPAASPRIWDHRSYEAAKEERDTLGIYRLDGDSLEVACVVGQWVAKEWVGKPRPKAISLEYADVVLRLRRVQ